MGQFKKSLYRLDIVRFESINCNINAIDCGVNPSLDIPSLDITSQHLTASNDNFKHIHTSQSSFSYTILAEFSQSSHDVSNPQQFNLNVSHWNRTHVIPADKHSILLNEPLK